MATEIASQQDLPWVGTKSGSNRSSDENVYGGQANILCL